MKDSLSGPFVCTPEVAGTSIVLNHKGSVFECTTLVDTFQRGDQQDALFDKDSGNGTACILDELFAVEQG